MAKKLEDGLEETLHEREKELDGRVEESLRKQRKEMERRAEETLKESEETLQNKWDGERKETEEEKTQIIARFGVSYLFQRMFKTKIKACSWSDQIHCWRLSCKF